METTRFRSSGRHLQVSNSSFTIFRFQFSQRSRLTFSLHSLNQLAMLLMSPYLGIDSFSQIRRRGLTSAQPRWLGQSTHFMFAVLVSPSTFSPSPARSPPPTQPPRPCCAESAGGLVTLLLSARKRHKAAQPALSSPPIPLTHVLTKAVLTGALKYLY